MFINLLSAILKYKFKFFLILFLFFSNTSFAVFKNDVETTSYILGEPSCEGFDNNSYTHDFLIACFEENNDKVKTFLSNEKFDINKKFYYKNKLNSTNDIFLTGLYLASSYNCKNTVKQLLLDPEINPNVIVKEGLGNTTALHIACERGYTDVVDLLLDHKKTNVNKKAKMGVTALHLAVFKGNYKLVKKLLQVSDIDVLAKITGGRSAMEIALLYEHKKIANILRAHKDIDMSDDEMLALKAKMVMFFGEPLYPCPDHYYTLNTAIIILGFIGVIAGMAAFSNLNLWYYNLTSDFIIT